jgi:crotonobetainyl-CoA:carnitine CoA-transferase CaiB-like acyl-CoA transferase
VNPLWSSYRCADARWIYFVMIQSDRHWPDFCRALGQPDWLNDPRFKDSTARVQNCAALTGEIDRAVAARTADEWAPIFDRNNLVWAPVRTDAEVLDDPQAAAIGAFAAVDHPNIPECRVVNSPVEFGDAPSHPHRAAPELGQHTEEVALEMGLSWDEIARLKSSGTLG